MKDPQRLVDAEGPSGLLVAAMQGEALRPEAKESMRSALGIGAATIVATSLGTAGAATKTATTAPVAAKALTIGIAKWIGVVAIGSVAAFGGVAGWRATHGRATPADGRSASTTPSLRDAPIAPALAETSLAVSSLPVASVLAPPTASVAPPRFASTPASRGVDVNEELRLLEESWRLLRAGDAGGALGSLERYRRSAPRGALRVEADALEIEALVLAGRRDDAVKRARVFLAAQPEGPLSERVRRSVGDGGT